MVFPEAVFTSLRRGGLRLSCLLAAALALALAGAPLAAGPASPRFTHLSVDDGLSQSSVQRILQDRKGFMWFGTQEGLNRYDGYRFTVHRARNQPGFLGDHDITALIADRRGDLLVGTSRGLYRYDLETGRFDARATAADLEVLEVVEAGDGHIFFTGSDGRLWVLEPDGGDRGARPMDGGSAGALTGVSALAGGAGGAIWVAADGRLLEVENAPAGTPRIREALQGLGPVAVLATDMRGDVWIGRADADLLRYRPGDGRLDSFANTPRNPLAILPARDGQVWIGARGAGLHALDPASGAIAIYRHDPADPASLSTDDVSAIYEDAVGSLWIGVWVGGVHRFDPHAQAFTTLRSGPGGTGSLPAAGVTALAESPDGELWLASRRGLVSAGDPRSGRPRLVTSLPGRSRFFAIAPWASSVLVGTAQGLVALDAASGRQVALDPALRAHGLDTRPVTAIRTASGVAWIASGTDLFRATRAAPAAPAAVERFELPLSKPVSALSMLAGSRLWIGSEDGEVVLADLSGAGPAVGFRALDAGQPSDGESLASRGWISALHEDQHRQLWVGTRRGLARIELRNYTVSWLTERNGLPSTTIAGIAGDADGRIWLGTNRGLTRIDPSSGVMAHFGERDGAQGKGYAEGAWASGASGRLYFAGDGITVFDPRDVGASDHRPGVAFTALEILHRPVAPSWRDPGSPLDRTLDSQSEVTLGPHATVISVEMAPLHYVDPPSNRLAYRLDGFDTEWIETDAHNRIATYTRLAPGRYVLRARAGTKNGVWSEEEATLAIHILPPWWRTRTALAGWSALALAGVALAWLAARRRTRVKLALLERETLRRESLTDPLTGLHNRRFLATHLQHEVPKLLRDSQAAGVTAKPGADLVLLLIDVDHFKSINDRHSHAAGDQVLARIGQVLREYTRDSDLAVRWGGDEFLVVGRGVERGAAAQSAERLRAAVEAVSATGAADGAPACTISIGFAAFPFLPHEPGALTWEQTLELADYALRLTKRRRRNSYTGLEAGPGVSAAALTSFLAAGGTAPLPAGVELVTPDAREPGAEGVPLDSPA